MSSEIELPQGHPVHEGRREIPDRGVSDEGGPVHDQGINVDVALLLDESKDQDHAQEFDQRISEHDLLKLLKSLQKPGDIDRAGQDLDREDHVQRLVLRSCEKPDEEPEETCGRGHHKKPQNSQFPEDLRHFSAVVSECRYPQLPVSGDPQVPHEGKISGDGRGIAESAHFSRAQDSCDIRLDHQRNDHRKHLVDEIVYVVFLYTLFLNRFHELPSRSISARKASVDCSIHLTVNMDLTDCLWYSRSVATSSW